MTQGSPERGENGNGIDFSAFMSPDGSVDSNPTIDPNINPVSGRVMDPGEELRLNLGDPDEPLEPRIEIGDFSSSYSYGDDSEAADDTIETPSSDVTAPISTATSGMTEINFPWFKPKDKSKGSKAAETENDNLKPAPPRVEKEKPSVTPRHQKNRKPKQPHTRSPLSKDAKRNIKRGVGIGASLGVVALGFLLPWDSVLPHEEAGSTVAPRVATQKPTVAVPSSETPTIPVVPFPTLSEDAGSEETTTSTSSENVTATPTPTPTSTETPTPTKKPTATASVSPTPTKASTPTVSPSATPSSEPTPRLTTSPTPVETPTPTTETPTLPPVSPSDSPTTKMSVSPTIVISGDVTQASFRQKASDWWNRLWHQGGEQNQNDAIKQQVIDELRAKGFNVVEADVNTYPQQATLGLSIQADTAGTITYPRHTDQFKECVNDQKAATFENKVEENFPELQGSLRLKEKGWGYKTNPNLSSMTITVNPAMQTRSDAAAALAAAIESTVELSPAIEASCAAMYNLPHP